MERAFRQEFGLRVTYRTVQRDRAYLVESGDLELTEVLFTTLQRHNRRGHGKPSRRAVLTPQGLRAVVADGYARPEDVEAVRLQDQVERLEARMADYEKRDSDRARRRYWAQRREGERREAERARHHPLSLDVAAVGALESVT